MRNGFIQELYELATRDERIVFLTGDLGFGVVEKFAQSFPDRFYNVGISEQNMIGLATALAEAGFIPFCYSIAPFSLLRPYEFIKDGPVLHNAKVRIVGIGGGFEYTDLGYTHFCLEDVAITRVFPNLRSYFPVNSINARKMLENTYDKEGPIYYRIGKNGKSLTDELVADFSASGIEKIYENLDSKIAVISLSSTTDQVKKAYETTTNKFNFYALTQINPTPRKELLEILKKNDKIITVEAHYLNGGIGTIVAEIVAEENLNCKLVRLAVKKVVDGLIGDQNFLENRYNIDSEEILRNI